MKKIIDIADDTKHSFCIAKWLKVTMHFGMGENHSCYHPPIHRWNLDQVKLDPSKLHNTDQKLQRRKEMLNGVRPDECNYCWQIEDLDPNVISDRKRFNNDSWATSERITTIKNSKWDTHFNPVYLELSFSNTCNFACSYCSPGQSSKWEQEIRRLGSYPVDDPTVHKDKMHDMILEEANPYIEAFWQWLPNMYKDLEHLRITGGEPLATKSFIKLLDYIANNENKKLNLSINSNLCVPDKNLQAFFNKAKFLLESKSINSITVYTSMDTWGKQAEYIRDGLDIKRWELTVRQVHQLFSIPIRIMVTFGVMSIFSFNLFIDKVLELRKDGIDIQFNIARLTNPKQFDLRILPDEADIYFQSVNNKINNSNLMKRVEMETWKMTYKYWQSRNSTMNLGEKIYLQDQFFKFINEYDKRRNLNFNSTFPELSSWI
jgi:organic radical activating enzyme